MLEARSFGVDILGLPIELQSLGVEAQSLATEPRSLDVEAWSFPIEPRSLAVEARTLVIEPRRLAAEPRTLARQPSCLDAQARRLGGHKKSPVAGAFCFTQWPGPQAGSGSGWRRRPLKRADRLSRRASRPWFLPATLSSA